MKTINKVFFLLFLVCIALSGYSYSAGMDGIYTFVSGFFSIVSFLGFIAEYRQ